MHHQSLSVSGFCDVTSSREEEKLPKPRRLNIVQGCSPPHFPSSSTFVRLGRRNEYISTTRAFWEVFCQLTSKHLQLTRSLHLFSSQPTGCPGGVNSSQNHIECHFGFTGTGRINTDINTRCIYTVMENLETISRPG